MPATDAGRWDRVKELFGEAQSLPDEARAQWLAAACGADVGLYAEVGSLLAESGGAEGFLETPAFATPEAAQIILADTRPLLAADLAGRRIGPYRLVRELGRGGMGVVCLAARDDLAYDKLVAVKLVQGAVLAPELLQRFYEERRILADLEHPNVARLLDAGTTEDGLPYVVMEFVEGDRIDAYCRAHRLATRQRLELFLQVCAAVQYAHQRLVVHRDIKAGNILVTAQGVPKLLDFGIAKILAPEPNGLALTRTGVRALTLESASPEQVRGEPVTVSSDVYSLGVLLYLLLTERSPYPGPPTTPPEMMRAICEEEPARPSDVVTAAGPNDAAARRLCRDLRGDLDLIVLEALRKEPDRRYASVEQLAADIQRYLSGLPVRAAPDSWRYRAGKLLRRRRLAIAVIAAATVVVLTGAGVSLQQARIARRERASAQQRFDMVRRLARAVVFDFNEALEAVPGTTSARKLLVARAIEYLDGLAQQQPSDRVLLAELAEAYLRVGEIQGDPTRPNLGDGAGAVDSFNHALEIYSRLAENGAGAATRSGLAATHNALATQSWAKGDATAAREHLEQALRLLGALSAADPGNKSHPRQLAGSHYLRGQIELRQGRPAEAALDYTRAARLFGELLAADPADAVAERGLAVSYMKLGDAALSASKQDESVVWYRKSASTLRGLAARQVGRRDIARLSAYAALRTAEGLQAGAPAEAETFAAQAIAELTPAAHADSSNAQAQSDLAYAHLVLGGIARRRGKHGPASEALSRAGRLLEASLAANPSNADARRLLGLARIEQGGVALARRGPRAALRFYADALPLLEAPQVRSASIAALAGLYRDLGNAHSALAAASAAAPSRASARAVAREWYAKSVGLWRELATGRPLDPTETAALREASRKAQASP